MGRVLVIGSSNTDLVCRADRLPAPGETVRGTSFASYAGGKGANQAVAAARAGADVVFVGATGDDAFGAARLADLASEGIDVSRVRVAPGIPSGVALIVVDAVGENQIVVVPGANAAVDATSAERAVTDVTYDVLSLTLEIPFETVAAAVAINRPGVTTVLNAAPFDERVAGLAPAIDVLICNENEASRLLGRPVERGTAMDAAAEMIRLGCRAAAITLGRNGVVVADVDECWRVPAPIVEAVDTTGAGDAFCGSVAAWLAAGRSLREAMGAGVAAGSIAVSRPGAQPSLPRRDEIERVLERMMG